MTAATPKTGTRAWFAILAAHDIADSLRRLRLPCAARLSLPTATPQDWDDIGTELAALAIDELREHERRAVRDAVRHMARGEPVGAATVLSRLRGVVGPQNLYGADLRSANLSGADLRSANLRSANLRSANLRGAYRHTSDRDITGWTVRDGRLERA